MKKINNIMLIAGACLMLTSCNDFLDKLPDDRANLNTEEKITMLLTSAYGTRNNAFVQEFASDNMAYNGATYVAQPNQEQNYKWINVTSESNDDPRSLWNNYYAAVGTANAVLDGIANFKGVPTTLNGQRAEALLCRAWAMFRLSNMFCMAYDPTHPEYLGLPYPKVSGVSVDERGTLQELYDNINADIEEALPMVTDAHLTVPKYHFNVRAAYAFAARFNLFYHKYDKAIEYATRAIGSDPTPLLRDWKRFKELGSADIGNEFVKSSDPANLMMHTAYSIYGRSLYSSNYRRYGHSSTIYSYETWYAPTMWGQSSGSTSAYVTSLYGSTPNYRFPRISEFFEYTDKVAGTGYAHIVDAPFTSGETLLVRAEAYALKKDYTNAIKDMQYWLSTFCNPTSRYYPILSEESIVDYMTKLDYAPAIPESTIQRSSRKKLHPQGFTIDEDGSTQECIINLILHMRRVETCHTGLRFNDVKRYGISYCHPHPDNPSPKEGDPEVFVPGDLRGAVQLPNDVITAGLEANPR